MPDFLTPLAEVITTFASIAAAAKAVDYSEGATRRWLRGKSEPAASAVRLLCEHTCFSAEWPFFGSDLAGRGERAHRVLASAFRLTRLADHDVGH